MVNPSSSKKENGPPWRQVRGEIPCGGSQTGEGSCGLVPPSPPVPGASEEERKTVEEQLRGGGVVVMVPREAGTRTQGGWVPESHQLPTPPLSCIRGGKPGSHSSTPSLSFLPTKGKCPLQEAGGRFSENILTPSL